MRHFVPKIRLHTFVYSSGSITSTAAATSFAVLRGQCGQRLERSQRLAVRLIFILRHHAIGVCRALSTLGSTFDPHPSQQCC